MTSTQEEDITTFTLSFGGVEFCLTPSCPTDADEATASDVMSISQVCNGEVLINLNNFVGTLRGKNHRIDAPATTTEQLQATSESVTENNDDDGNNGGNDNMSVDDGAPLTANPVEDTPSPKAKSEGEEEDKPKQRKGQQKLNFFGRHGKKQDEVCHVSVHMSCFLGTYIMYHL